MNLKKVIAGICTAALVLNNMSSITLMAAEPDVDTEERIFFDDRSEWITYTGKLSETGDWTQEGMLNDTGRWTAVGQGETTASITFQGTGIQVIANQYYNHNGVQDVTVTVDNGEAVALTLNTEPGDTVNVERSTFGKVVGEVTGLDYGVHTAVVNVPDKKLEFDGFYVLDSTRTYDASDLRKDLDKLPGLAEADYTTLSWNERQKQLDAIKTQAENMDLVEADYLSAKAQIDQLPALVPYQSESIPHSQMTASANSEVNPAAVNDGPASYAINDNTSNWWHSNWKTATASNIDGNASASNPIYITLDLGGSYWINEYHYRARTDGANQCNGVKDYTLSVANVTEGTPSDDQFRVVKTGTLSAVTTPQVISLERPVQATHVRLTATSSTATANSYVTASNLEIYRVGDASSLMEVLDQAKTLESTDFTEESYTVLQRAIDETDSMLAGRYVESEVAEQTAKLQAAMDGLKGINADLSSLTYRVGTGEAVSVLGFRPEIVEYSVELPSGTQGDITISGVVKDSVHASAIPQTVTIVENAAQAVLTVTTDGGAEKAYTVNFTVTAEPVDKGSLEALIDEYKANPPMEDDYTADTYQAYTAALTEAERVLASEAATQQHVEAAKAALEAAKAGLQLKSYAVSASAVGGNGCTVSVSTGTVEKFGSATFTAVGSAAYPFEGWYENEQCTGEPISVSADYTYENIRQDTRLYGKFGTFDKTYNPGTMDGSGVDISADLESIKTMKESTISFDFKLDDSLKGSTSQIALLSLQNETSGKSLTYFYQPSNGLIGINSASTETNTGFRFTRGPAATTDGQWHTLTVRLGKTAYRDKFDAKDDFTWNYLNEHVGVNNFSAKAWVQAATAATIGASNRTDIINFKGEIRNIHIKAAADDELHAKAVPASDRIAMTDLIAECKGMDTDSYTNASVEVLQTALTAAEALDDNSARWTAYNAYDALKSAKESLIRKSGNANLASLTYQIGSGEAVSLSGFSADELNYAVELPARTEGSIAVNGMAADSAASVESGAAEIVDGRAEASVTVTAEDGTVKVYTISFTVAPVKVEQIDITGGDTVEKGTTLALTAAVSPQDAANQSVNWSSSAEQIATVDENGVVTGIAAGTAVITAAAADGSGISATITITVTETILVESIVISGGDTLEKGETLNLTASVVPENASNKGIIWSSSNEMAATVDNEGRVTGTGTGTAVITATALDESGISASVTITVIVKAAISASAEGSGTVQINGSTAAETASEKIALGEKVTLSAAAAEGYKFQYWKQAETNKILSKTAVFETYAGADTEYVAVFAETASCEVTFFWPDGRVYQVLNVSAGAGSVTLPEGPLYPGYKFQKWDHTEESILAGIANGTPMEVKPIYVSSVENYVLTVNGGSGSGSYVPLGRAAVTAGQPGAGMKFSHWTNGNGDIVSYEKAYSFIVSGDTVLTAVYVEEEATVEQKVQITITSVEPMSDVKKMAFTAERFLPAGFTVVEHGVILTSNGNLHEKDFVIGASGVLKGTATTKANIGTYLLRKGSVASGATWYGRGYVTYRDVKGVVHTEYSSIQSGTANW